MPAWRHPEQKKDEILLGNLTQETFERIEWKTKRMGDQQFDLNGDLIPPGFPRSRPVFIGREEIETSSLSSEIEIDDSDRIVW